MKQNNIYNLWNIFINNEYKDYFLSNDKIWNQQLNRIKNYIDDYKKVPSSYDKDINIKKMGHWLKNQFKLHAHKKYIMQNEIIYNIFTNFINSNKYIIYFKNNESLWFERKKEVQNYIDTYNKKPVSTDTDIKIKSLSRWINMQHINYKQKKDIMKHENIRNSWIAFINDTKYKNFLISNEELWKTQLNKIICYIKINNKKPSRGDEDINIKSLGDWIHTQKINYCKKKFIMKKENIRKLWEEIINDPLYKKYFK
jgi:hypothetical protein